MCDIRSPLLAHSLAPLTLACLLLPSLSPRFLLLTLVSCNLLFLLLTGFFIVTQVLYTLGFVFLLFAVIGTLAIELCFITDREAFVMKVLSFVMFLSGECVRQRVIPRRCTPIELSC